MLIVLWPTFCIYYCDVDHNLSRNESDYFKWSLYLGLLLFLFVVTQALRFVLLQGIHFLIIKV